MSWLFKGVSLTSAFVAVLGHCCCEDSSPVAARRGSSLVAEHGLLIVVTSHCRAQALGAWASVVAAHGLSSWGSQALEHRIVVVAHKLSCSPAYGIFPTQGSNPRLLHWQADSVPLCHQGSPLMSLR